MSIYIIVGRRVQPTHYQLTYAAYGNITTFTTFKMLSALIEYISISASVFI